MIGVPDNVLLEVVRTPMRHNSNEEKKYQKVNSKYDPCVLKCIEGKEYTSLHVFGTRVFSGTRVLHIQNDQEIGLDDLYVSTLV